MKEIQDGSKKQEPKRQMTTYSPELLLADSYKGNSADLPWLGSTKDDIARMQSEKAGREKRERLKEGHSS